MSDLDHPVSERDGMTEADDLNVSVHGASSSDDYEDRNKLSKYLLWFALAMLALAVIVFGANVIANHMSMPPHGGLTYQMRA